MWLRIVTILLVGYFCMGRSFAYWGIPPLHVFVGEVVLAGFLFCGPRTRHGRWLWTAMETPALHRFRMLFLLSLAFGAFQVLRGVFLGYPALSAVRDLAFNYYPLYFFLGLWVGSQDAEFLPKFVRLAAWANGLYGILFILVLNRIPLFFPGVSGEVGAVPIFGQPMFSAAILLGLLSYEKDLRKVFLLLLLNAAVLLGMLIRGEWLAFALGLFVWSAITKNLKRALLGGAAVAAVVGLLYVTNLAIPAPESRGGTISARDVAGRILAPVNSDLAADLTLEAQTYEDTTVWRALWWAEIWSSVHANSLRALLGHGYGFPLGDLVPYLEGEFIRTPHNAFFYVLGYTGWVGVGLFVLFQRELGRLLWNVYSGRGRPFGIIFWATMLIFSLSTAFFEAPYGAIPFYLLAGCACAPLLCAENGMLAVARNPMNRVGLPSPTPRAAG